MEPTRSRVAAVPAVVASASRALSPLSFSEASLSAAKWLALVLMVIDHSNKYLFDGAVPWMFALGRVSMPLFAFVLGYNLARPGMLASGGYRRLALRLAAFGLLATVPFIVLNKLPTGWPLNMMFTLLVAVLSAWLFDMRRPGATIAACLVLAWGGALGEYWWPAIGLTLCVWAYQREPSRALIAGFFSCLVLLWFVNGNLWALAVLPVLYALRRWWRMVLPRAQWVFYAFYPLHLVAFWLFLSMKG